MGNHAIASAIECRSWIRDFNALSEAITGKSAIVTSWHRDDATAHNGGNAADFRTRHYTGRELKDLVTAATAQGIPVIKLYMGTPNQHLHCGELATLVYEQGTD
jgi:hypothetical protein